MKFEEIESKIKAYKSEGKTLFTTSSFQSHSLVLVHILSRIDRDIPVYFINTGYHFPETMAYKDQIAEQFGIQVFELFAAVPRNMQKDNSGRLLFTSDPDHCCFLNKIQPVE